jgi:hypothetical protein
MFVQVALKKLAGSPSPLRIAAAVEAAIETALPEQTAFCFVQPAPEGEAGAQAACGGPRLAIVIHAGRCYAARDKRRLFGRLLDRLEREFAIARTDVLIGIVETPAVNWSAGYAEQQWLEGLSYRLP